MICLYVGVCFVLPWTVESFPFMLWRLCNKLKWAPFELFAPSPLLRVRSWLHPFFQGHCEQKAIWDERVIYVAGHPLLNRRCTRLPGYFYLPKLQLLKARYSLTVLKVPLNSSQSIDLSLAVLVLSVDVSVLVNPAREPQIQWWSCSVASSSRPALMRVCSVA